MLELVRLEDVEGWLDPIPLNSLATSPSGIEAQPASSGLGLPPVGGQWLEGAGDGATFRGSRLLPRDLDLVLHFSYPTRAALQEALRKAGGMFLHPMRLVANLDGREWTTTVHHVGGGEYDTKDTDHETNLRITVTLRAPDPRWFSSTETKVTKTNVALADQFLPYGDGDSYTEPVVRVTGPGTGIVFRTLRRAGSIMEPAQALRWRSLLRTGETLEIDCARGTVTSGSVNRYAGLDSAPAFPRVGPGRSYVSIGMDNTSPAFTGMFESRTNFVTNPSFETNTTGWTATNLGTITRTAGGLAAAGTGIASAFCANLAGGGSETGAATVRTIVSDLTVGKTYTVKVSYRVSERVANASPAMLEVVGTGRSVSGVSVASIDTARTYELSLTFTATSTSHTLSFTPAYQVTMLYPRQFYNVIPTRLDLVYVGEAGGYFDGGNTNGDAHNAYAWTGTAHASKSTLTPVIDTTQSKIEVVYRQTRRIVW